MKLLKDGFDGLRAALSPTATWNFDEPEAVDVPRGGAPTHKLAIPTWHEIKTEIIGETAVTTESTNYRVITETELLALHKGCFTAPIILFATGAGGVLLGFMACCIYIGVLG